MISDDQLKEWRALCEKATPGEWRVINEIDPNPIFLKTWGPDYKTMWFIQRGGENDKPNFSTLVNVTPRETMMAEQDVRFIAASRTAVPALLDEVERLRELLYHSEQFRQAYRKGKLQLYSRGGEIAAAAMEALPCSEGPLEREAMKAVGLRTGWVEISERDALRSKLAKAKDGLRDIFDLLDSGYLCRDISRDAEPDWALRQIEPVMKLKAARAALDAE